MSHSHLSALQQVRGEPSIPVGPSQAEGGCVRAKGARMFPAALTRVEQAGNSPELTREWGLNHRAPITTLISKEGH